MSEEQSQAVKLPIYKKLLTFEAQDLLYEANMRNHERIRITNISELLNEVEKNELV